MGDEDTTRIIRKPKHADDETKATKLLDTEIDETVDNRNRSKSSNASDDPETKIFRPKKASASSEESAGSSDSVADELVVGWLVVVEGPGKGTSHPLGYGVNSIGRGAEERVSLNYGDNEISREKHASITFDHKNTRFYLQHGGGTNVIYIGDDPVLQPVELTGREVIGIGDTKVCFVPFCDKSFSW